MANSQPATAVGHWLALQPEDIETATERRAAGESMNAIAASLGVTRQTLGAALRREATRRS
jgi:lambda repressor-like predicted transcriptional regulator